MTGALVLLVLLLGGGAYGAWWYNQQQYYVGVQNGYVAIFRGTNQSLAGISLSSLLTRSTLKVSQLGTTDQSTISQTISKSSLSDAKALIDGLQTEADQCQRSGRRWRPGRPSPSRTTPRWPGTRRPRPSRSPRSRRPTNPGRCPATPDAASCAPASAFGIPASALPGPATPAAPATTPTVKPLGEPDRDGPAKKSSTPAAG